MRAIKCGKHAGVSVLAGSAVLLLASAGLFGALAAEATAATTVPAGLTVRDVETVFWVCDHVAETRGIYSAPVELCSAATEELKQKKFNGDFLQLLDWWRENKQREHARLQAGGATQFGRGVPQ